MKEPLEDPLKKRSSEMTEGFRKRDPIVMHSIVKQLGGSRAAEVVILDDTRKSAVLVPGSVAADITHLQGSYVELLCL